MDAVQQFILSDLLNKVTKKEITIAEYQELLTATLSATMKAQRLAKEESAQVPGQTTVQVPVPAQANATVTPEKSKTKTPAAPKKAPATTKTPVRANATKTPAQANATKRAPTTTKKVARKTQVKTQVKKIAHGFVGEIDESNVEDYIDYFEDDLDEALSKLQAPVTKGRGRPKTPAQANATKKQ